MYLVKSLLPAMLVAIVLLFNSPAPAQSRLLPNKSPPTSHRFLRLFSPNTKLYDRKCTTDQQCSTFAHGTAYCYQGMCICPVGQIALLDLINHRASCVPFTCSKDADCGSNDVPDILNEKCLKGQCGCAKGTKADKWRCVKE